MEPQPEVAAVAAHFADRSRARIMMDLLDGSARPASHLATAAGVAASTASGHLARLTEAGLLTVENDGRTRRYRLAGPEVGLVLESLIPLAPTPAARGLREHTRWERLRVARTCYDHVAGSLGTDILAGLLEVDALVRTDGVPGTAPGAADRLSAPVRDNPYALGPGAAETFGALGIDLVALQEARRPLLRCCMDWTEQRHHLAGGLGAAVLDALVERDWVARRPGRRDLAVGQPDLIARWLESDRAAPAGGPRPVC